MDIWLSVRRLADAITSLTLSALGESFPVKWWAK